MTRAMQRFCRLMAAVTLLLGGSLALAAPAAAETIDLDAPTPVQAPGNVSVTASVDAGSRPTFTLKLLQGATTIDSAEVEGRPPPCDPLEPDGCPGPHRWSASTEFPVDKPGSYTV